MRNRTYIANMHSRTMVGVLYSVSAGMEGELFPIYTGRNEMGSGAYCDIILREGTVLGRHAVLLARQLPGDEGEKTLRLTLSDEGSGGNLLIGGQPLREEHATLCNGDIITAGQHYQLLVVLFKNAESLSPDDGFERMPDTTRTAAAARIVRTEEQQVDVMEGASINFYRPTAKSNGDHSSNKTIVTPTQGV